MRSLARIILSIALLTCIGLGITGCTVDEPNGSSGNQDQKKASSPKGFLTEEDVERVLDVKNVKRTEVELNPTAEYQAMFENDKKQRLLIINVLKSTDWGTLESIGETETLQGLGERALRSSTYGIVFLKEKKIVALGGFADHPGGDQSGVADQKLLELALLVASRM